MDLFAERYPKTVERAADKLISGMSFSDKTRIANMTENKLIEFHKSYGHHIRMEFRLPGNDPLLESCRSISGLKEINGIQASFFILKAIWNKLQKSNVLRPVARRNPRRFGVRVKEEKDE